MQYNLLQKSFDHHCELFIEGYLPFELFEKIELIFEQRKELFTINLN